MSDLESLRKTIDECDKEIVKAIEKRFNIVKEMVKFKKDNNIKIFQPNREDEVLKKVDNCLQNKEYSKDLESIYLQIFKLSKEIQQKILLDN